MSNNKSHFLCITLCVGCFILGEICIGFNVFVAQTGSKRGNYHSTK